MVHFSSARMYIIYYFQQPGNFYCMLLLYLFPPKQRDIIHGFIIQRVFIMSFATQHSYSRRLIKAATSFRTTSNHLSTSKFFIEKSRCPLIEFPMLLTTVSGETIVVFNDSKVISTVVLSIHLPHWFHLWSYLFFNFLFAWSHIETVCIHFD